MFSYWKLGFAFTFYCFISASMALGEEGILFLIDLSGSMQDDITWLEEDEDVNQSRIDATAKLLNVFGSTSVSKQCYAGVYSFFHRPGANHVLQEVISLDQMKNVQSSDQWNQQIEDKLPRVFHTFNRRTPLSYALKELNVLAQGKQIENLHLIIFSDGEENLTNWTDELEKSKQELEELRNAYRLEKAEQGKSRTEEINEQAQAQVESIGLISPDEEFVLLSDVEDHVGPLEQSIDYDYLNTKVTFSTINMSGDNDSSLSQELMIRIASNSDQNSFVGRDFLESPYLWEDFLGQFCNLRTFSGAVFWDRNTNGVLEYTELRVPNSRVVIYDEKASTQLYEQISDSAGNFLFNELDPGEYTLRVFIEEDAWQTQESPLPISFTGDAPLIQNVGFAKWAEFHVGVYEDNNFNEIFDPEDELVPEIPILLKDPKTEKVLRELYTNAEGRLIIKNVKNGEYLLEAKLPPKAYVWKPVSQLISVQAGDIVRKNWGLQYGNLLQGVVFHDKDSDGKRSEQEKGLALRKVLLESIENPGLFWTVTSNEEGKFQFPALKAGNYRLSKPSYAGDSGGIEPLMLSFKSGEILQVEIPIFLEGQLAGKLFHDQNGNLTQDSLDLGISEVPIVLMDLADNVIAEGKTDTEGNFVFTGLVPQTYDVRWKLPNIYLEDSIDSIEMPVVEGQTSQFALGFQSYGTIAGIVNEDIIGKQLPDTPREVAAGQEIELFQGDTLIQEAVTNANGEFLFLSVAPGFYSVHWDADPSWNRYSNDVVADLQSGDVLEIEFEGHFWPQILIEIEDVSTAEEAPELPSVGSRVIHETGWAYELKQSGEEELFWQVQPGTSRIEFVLPEFWTLESKVSPITLKSGEEALVVAQVSWIPPFLDSDEDGIENRRDQCPRTPIGAWVDEFGCWSIGEFLFAFDRSELNPDVLEDLDKIVEILNNNPNLKVEIQGHTDNYGTFEYNQRLSEDRALAIFNYLIEKGIEGYRLKTTGYSFSEPRVSNDTDVNRAKNRRVEFNPIYDDE